MTTLTEQVGTLKNQLAAPEAGVVLLPGRGLRACGAAVTGRYFRGRLS